MVDYTPLWKTIHEREITQHAMLQDKVLDKHTLDSLKRNMNFSMTITTMLLAQEKRWMHLMSS